MDEKASLWTRYCENLYLNRELDVALDISRMRFDAGFFERMTPALEQALAKMQVLETGFKLNVDEDRMVGHYWLRNPDIAPTEEIGELIRGAVEDIGDFATGVSQGYLRGAGGPFENLLVIGIGGSALGPQFLAHALADGGLAPYFLDNTDPDGIDRTLSKIGGELERTLVVVVSKSGGTPETRNGMHETQAAYKRTGLRFAEHAVAVTQAGSQLDLLAQEQGWLRRFPMWDWVGGRTSITSAVGLLPASLWEIPIHAFLAGAAEMDELTRNRNVRENPAALLALMWYHGTNGRGERDMVLLPYKDRLELLGRYLQQLVMESLGKQHDRKGNVVHQGITVYGNKGSTDQHAYVQQLRDGVSNFFVTFIEVLRDRHDIPFEVEPGVTTGDYLSGFLQGTRQALTEAGRESITITIGGVTPRSVGQLVALFERAVGLYAELIDVNAYHQPGVEAGKRAAQGVLELQQAVLDHLRSEGQTLSAEDLASAIGRPDDVETIYKILEHLVGNASRGVVSNRAETPSGSLYRIED